MASAEFKKWVAGITVDFHKTSQDAEKSARKALTRNPQFSIFIIEEKESILQGDVSVPLQTSSSIISELL